MRRKIVFEGTKWVEVELRNEESQPILSVCGSHGQNRDELEEYMEGKDNPIWNFIDDIWKKYHLNGMHAGTPKQEKFIEEHLEGRYEYDKACKLLEENDLLCDKDYLVNGEPYKYGTAWLYQPIPDGVLDKIKALINQPDDEVVRPLCSRISFKYECKGGREWKCTIGYGGHSSKFDYTAPMGELPKKEDLIFCLLNDTFDYDNYKDPFSFMSEFGYASPNSMENARIAERAYKGCKSNSRKMHRLFTDEEIKTLYDELEDYR